MAVFIVTWNLNNEKSNYSAARDAFIKQLESYTNKADSGLESVRFIEAKQSADQVDAFLRKKLDKNDRLLVSKMNNGEHQGWLDQSTWDWINARL